MKVGMCMWYGEYPLIDLWSSYGELPYHFDGMEIGDGNH